MDEAHCTAFCGYILNVPFFMRCFAIMFKTRCPLHNLGISYRHSSVIKYLTILWADNELSIRETPIVLVFFFSCLKAYGCKAPKPFVRVRTCRLLEATLQIHASCIRIAVAQCRWRKSTKARATRCVKCSPPCRKNRCRYSIERYAVVCELAGLE